MIRESAYRRRSSKIWVSKRLMCPSGVIVDEVKSQGVDMILNPESGFIDTHYQLA